MVLAGRLIEGDLADVEFLDGFFEKQIPLEEFSDLTNTRG